MAQIIASFSVVLTTYNFEAYIEEAIDSVLAQLYPHWELIIVDDHSTDNTVKRITPYLSDSRIKLLCNEKNQGTNLTTIRGIKNITTNYFGILDGDDTLNPATVGVMLDAHKKYINAGYIYSQFVHCDTNLVPTHLGYCHQLTQGKKHIDYIASSHFRTYKLDYYNKTAGLDPNIKIVGDRDLSYKMEEVGDTIFIDKVLYNFRLRPDSLSNINTVARLKERKYIREQALKRRI